MKTLGIIAEYNPFHFGHAYQLSQAKLRHPDHAIVIAMSGNLVQRGEFAVLDKWTRGQIACHHGADLVVELPLLASLQAADYFAYWAIDLLQQLSVDRLVFGTETATSDQLMSLHHWLKAYQTEIDQRIPVYLGQGLSYPASMQLAINSLEVKPPIIYDSRQANNLLGLKYIHWLDHFRNLMAIEAIPRNNSYYSGSQIRKKMQLRESITTLVPKESLNAINDQVIVTMEDYFTLIKGQIISKSLTELSNIRGMREGFERQIAKTIHQVTTYDALVDCLVSKRWTRAAVQRILMMILLNITDTLWIDYQEDYQSKAHVRVLAYTSTGRELLQKYRKNDGLELFSNLTQTIYPKYELTVRADQIYRLPYSTLPEQNIARFPNN